MLLMTTYPISAVYQIQKEEFESVIIEKYFNIDSETLQSKTVYYSENSTWRNISERLRRSRVPGISIFRGSRFFRKQRWDNYTYS